MSEPTGNDYVNNLHAWLTANTDLFEAEHYDGLPHLDAEADREMGEGLERLRAMGYGVHREEWGMKG